MRSLATALARERCRHGIDKEACCYCTVRDPNPLARRIPKKATPTSTVALVERCAPDLRPGFVVVTPGDGRERACRALDATTDVVHINGIPHLWLIESILERGPNVRVIQCPPSRVHELRERHRKLCEARGVELRAAHIRPELSWADSGWPRSPSWHAHRRFLMSLVGDQAAKWIELQAMGFETAAIVSRYFCLNGEEYVNQHTVSVEFGYANTAAIVTARVNAVLIYLDPTFPATITAGQMARELVRSVERLRPILHSAGKQREEAAALGLPYLPAALPLARLPQYRSVVPRYREVNRLHPSVRRAMTRRFGLDDLEHPTFRTLAIVGDEMGISRERVRQLVAAGLEELGIGEAE